ncbi:MAG: hypothetical protein R2851_16700 [Caldilineaceae bacterium]
MAVVASGLEYYGPSRTLMGMEDAATQLGYSLLPGCCRWTRATTSTTC